MLTVSSYCEGNPSQKEADRRGRKRHFPFNRSHFPCNNTAPATLRTVETPALDDLATQGTVFPRTHVGGNVCKPSRGTMLLGRHQRHLKYVYTEGWLPSAYHAIAWWLQHGTDAPTPTYKSYLWGKAEILFEREGGFDGGEEGRTSIGQFPCEDTTPCPADLENGRIPSQAEATGMGIGDVRAGYLSDIQSQESPPGSGQFTSKLDHPLFIWYAPEIPHETGNPPPLYFSGKYASFERRAQEHLGRITWLDAGVGALLNDLKRTCICGNDGQPQSLYDNTVVLFLADNGFLLRGAKRNELENTQRTVLIVNEPGHRTCARSYRTPRRRVPSTTVRTLGAKGFRPATSAFVT
jgi:hypothetical protein